MFIIKNSTLVSLPISSSSASPEISNFAGNSAVEGKKNCVNGKAGCCLCQSQHLNEGISTIFQLIQTHCELGH